MTTAGPVGDETREAAMADVLAENARLRAELDEAWRALGGRDVADSAELWFGPAGGPMTLVEPSRRRTLGEVLVTIEQGMQALHDVYGTVCRERDEAVAALAALRDSRT